MIGRATMRKLTTEAKQLGANGILHDPTDHDVLCAALDIVETPGRRLRAEDIPPGGELAIIAAYDQGDALRRRQA